MLELNFNPFPLLTAPRLLLRQVEETDVREIFFLRSDERMMRYLDREPARSLDEAADFIEKSVKLEKDNEAITWAIALKEEAKLIGTICYWNIQKEHYRAEIGYALAPGFQGRGIMQEALSAVLNYGFGSLKLHSVEANVNPANEASIKLLERNQFVREAYFKENYFYNGKFIDTVIYSRLKSGSSKP